MPRRPSRGPRPSAVALVTPLAVGVATLSALVPTAAQTTDQGAVSSPVATVDPISSAPSLPPALDVAALSVAPDGASVRVSLDFAQPVTVPGEGYRLSVSVGDPSGQRTRASLLPAEGEDRAVVEVGNGLTFREDGPTAVDVGDATVELVVPVDGVGPGAALWVDGQLTDGNGQVATAASPAFAYDALVGRSIDGAAPGGSWGWTTTAGGQRFADPVLVGGAPPTVATRNRVVIVDAADPAPTSLLGQPVVGADLYLGIRLAGAAAPDVDGAVLIDRADGAVTLLGPAGTPVAAASPGSDRSWLSEDLAGPAADGPLSVSIVPEAVAALLGGPFDRSTFAVDLAAVYPLADGRVVTVSGVATTLTWLDQLAAEVPTSTTTSAGVVAAPSEDEASFPLLPVLATLAGVLVLAGVAAVVVARRGARRRPAEASDDGEVPSATGPLLDVRGRSSPRRPEPELAVGAEPRPEPAPAVGAEPERESEPGVGAEPEPAGPAAPAGTSRAPDDVLAAFEAELAELSARVDRLDRGRRPAPGPGDR